MSRQEVTRFRTKNVSGIQEGKTPSSQKNQTAPNEAFFFLVFLLFCFVSSSFLWLFIREEIPKQECGSGCYQNSVFVGFQAEPGCVCAETHDKERLCFAPRAEKAGERLSALA